MATASVSTRSSLSKEALPIIRYRTRDLTRLLPGQARPMRRIDKITGRSDDMMIIRGVNVFPTQVEEQILKIEALAPHYEIHVEKEGNLDHVTVRVEPKPEAAPQAETLTVEVIKELQHRVKTHIGISTKVDLAAPGTLARSEGKAKHVFDNRPK